MNHKKLLNVALRVLSEAKRPEAERAREVWECKELPNYFTPGPEKFLLDAMQTAKNF